MAAKKKTNEDVRFSLEDLIRSYSKGDEYEVWKSKYEASVLCRAGVFPDFRSESVILGKAKHNMRQVNIDLVEEFLRTFSQKFESGKKRKDILDLASPDEVYDALHYIMFGNNIYAEGMTRLSPESVLDICDKFVRQFFEDSKAGVYKNDELAGEQFEISKSDLNLWARKNSEYGRDDS